MVHASDCREHRPTTPPGRSTDPLWQEIVESARRSFPTVDLPAEVYVAYLRERIPADVAEPVGLRQMYTADLYLACACARGDRNAVAVFEEHYLSRLDRVLGGMGFDADTRADVKQDVRSCLLVGDGQRAEIVDFVGRGDLRSWVRVVAVRRALRRRLAARHEVAVEDCELLQRIVAPGDPELDYAKRIYRDAFQRAFANAVQTLPDRERTILRQHHLDGLTVEQLGALYRVHRATAARMVVRARVLLLEATRADMMTQLEVESQELDSILRMIRSRIDVSVQDLKRRRRR
jgi:RNA polymerase sigma-70 factor (ECF subfamily)